MLNKKVYNYGIVAISSFPLHNLFLGKLLVFLWVAIAIVFTIRNKTYKAISKKDLKNIIFLSMFSLYLIVELFVFGFDREVLHLFGTNIFFLFFPFLLVINKSFIEKKTLDNSLISFFLANAFLAILCWFKIFRVGFFKLIEKNSFYHPVFRKLFADTTEIHLPYLGLLFVFSIFIGFYLIRRSNKNLYKTVFCFFCLLFILSITVFSSRMAIFSFCLITIFYIYNYLNKNLRIILSTLFFIVISILTYYTPIKNRVKEVFYTKWILPSKELNNKNHQVNFRYGIYYCSINNLKENFFLGVGKRNIQRHLQECYSEFSYVGYDDFTSKRYNTHNQYLDFLISYGFFGGVFLIGSIFYGLFLKKRAIIYNTFLILIILSLLTENLFNRYIGVLFFTFFNTLFFLRLEDKSSLIK